MNEKIIFIIAWYQFGWEKAIKSELCRKMWYRMLIKFLLMRNLVFGL